MKQKKLKQLLSIGCLVILLTCSSMNTKAISQPYIDVYTTVYDGDFIAVRVQNNTKQDVNPLILIYTNEQVLIIINDEKYTNSSNKISLTINSQSTINIIGQKISFTFQTNMVTNNSLIELEQKYPSSFLITAFNVGLWETLISIFLISPTIAYIWRKQTL